MWSSVFGKKIGGEKRRNEIKYNTCTWSGSCSTSTSHPKQQQSTAHQTSTTTLEWPFSGPPLLSNSLNHQATAAGRSRAVAIPVAIPVTAGIGTVGAVLRVKREGTELQDAIIIATSHRSVAVALHVHKTPNGQAEKAADSSQGGRNRNQQSSRAGQTQRPARPTGNDATITRSIYVEGPAIVEKTIRFFF